MVLPQTVLRCATRGPALVELKNGDAYSGTLAGVDNVMNIRLEDVIFTPRSEYRFERLKECTIRGQFVKFIRFPDDIIERVVAEELAAAAPRGRGGGGRGGGRGRGHGAVTSKLMVPSSVVGAVIGKGGETIKRLSAESGARIEVAKESDGAQASAERSITLVGTQESVDCARGLIEALAREKSSARGGGGRGGDRRPGRGGRSGGGGGGNASAKAFAPATAAMRAQLAGYSGDAPGADAARYIAGRAAR
mmetsp:Transcript_134456/g.389120  ORF Transcript_134456/g.389120 Transcript_134456/m.389120 type:complete len:250 (-) Transcript_134456:6-755(-)